MPAIFALDLGHTVGWAIGRPGAISRSGSFRPDGKGLAEKMLAFRRWLDKPERLRSLECILAEAPALHANFIDHFTIWQSVEMQGIAMMAGVDVRFVNTSSLKKVAAGHGRATKAEMKRAMRELGHGPATDHEADALALIEHFGDSKVIHLTPTSLRRA